MDTLNNTTNPQDSKATTKRHLLKLYRACRYALLLNKQVKSYRTSGYALQLNKQYPHLVNLKVAFKKGTASLDPFALSALVSALLELVDLQSDRILEAIKLGADEVKRAA